MVEGIGADIVSDITTNLIREPLIDYTRDVCSVYGIPTGEVDSGPLWDAGRKEWNNAYVQLPVANDRKLLLVPKAIVRQRMDYDQDEYYRDYVLEFLREEELRAGSSLVHLLRSGDRRVTKKDLMAKYGRGKSVLIAQTRRAPEILDRYRSDKRDSIEPPMTHIDLSLNTNTPAPDWTSLLNAVLSVSPGTDGATAFHTAVLALMSALFYPALCDPRRETEIHEGRKRIDITFTNVSTEGFFRWVALHYPAQHFFVECKNYSREIANPELDQIAGRFSPSRGVVGAVVCRHFEDKELFISRCRDTANDQRGFIIPLDDDDLKTLVAEASGTTRRPTFQLLKDRFDRLVM